MFLNGKFIKTPALRQSLGVSILIIHDLILQHSMAMKYIEKKFFVRLLHVWPSIIIFPIN